MRAVTMFLIAMGARITGRIYDMMSALSVTAMMILVESPAYLLDSGFLLSFGCVLGMGPAAEKICALAGAEKKWTKALVSPIALQLVTLPVEFNASARALRMLDETGIMGRQEIRGTKKVLRAAAMTYVAAVIGSLLQLLRLLILSGAFRKRDD